MMDKIHLHVCEQKLLFNYLQFIELYNSSRKMKGTDAPQNKNPEGRHSVFVFCCSGITQQTWWLKIYPFISSQFYQLEVQHDLPIFSAWGFTSFLGWALRKSFLPSSLESLAEFNSMWLSSEALFPFWLQATDHSLLLDPTHMFSHVIFPVFQPAMALGVLFLL